MSDIFCLYLKSMAKVSVCERGRENEREMVSGCTSTARLCRVQLRCVMVKGPGLRLK